MSKRKNSVVTITTTTPRIANKSKKHLAPADCTKLSPVSADTVELNFVERVELLDNGCWLWHGSMSTITKRRPNSMAVFSSAIGYKTHKKFTAHRYAYEKRIGELPDPKFSVLRNTCGLTRCVNPHHYELVTWNTILDDGARPALDELRKNATKCPKGLHDRLPENTYYTASGLKVVCRPCTQEIQRVMYARKKARKAKA
jgi:hypothetical protein